jgi:TDG/mug DNA glycosylase family protein
MERARGLPDIIAANLDVLFCGINPGLYSAQVGHHFARPGNRFWPALHRAGFTPRQLSPFEDVSLPDFGLGLTNIASRPSTAAAELTAEELAAGARVLRRKVRKFAPRFLAITGIGAYRTAFARPRATFGLQDETIGATKIWVLPNPSGLNASYRPADLARLYSELAAAASRFMP